MSAWTAVKKTWKNRSQGAPTTPLNAAGLNDLEDRLETVFDSVEKTSQLDTAGHAAAHNTVTELSRRARAAAIRGDERVKNKALTTSGVAPVMSSPPTFSQDASLPGGLTQSVNYAQSVYRWSGHKDPAYPSEVRIRGYTKAAGGYVSGAPSGRLEFDTDAAKISIRLNAVGTSAAMYVRLWVDDEATASVPQLLSSYSATQYLTWDFGSQARGRMRRITFEWESSANTLSMASVYVAATEMITSPSTISPRVVLVGDSQVQGAGGAWYCHGYAVQMARLLGWSDIWNLGVGTTGLIQTGSGGFADAGNYGSRLTDDVIAANPDVLYLQGTINDQNETGAAITAAAIDYVEEFRDSCPDALVIVTGPVFPATPTAAHLAVGTAMQSAASTLGVPYVDHLVPAVIKGTGNVGSPAGDGSADVYRNADNIHPSTVGHTATAVTAAMRAAQAIGVAL